MVSGRWPFSSGVDNANWVMPSAFTPEHGLVMLMVPRSEFRVEDDWHVSGLRGTGSKSVVLDEPLFVPGHRYTPFVGRTYPEARDAQGVALYGAPLLSVLPHTLAGPVVGMALGMVDAFVEAMRVRRTMAGQLQSETVVQHMRVAEASAMVEAARAIARANLAELRERGAGDAGFSDLDRARFRRDHAFIAKLCVGAANKLFEGGGGSALYEKSPLQRFHRDIHAGTHQVGLDWDLMGELYGRARFGLELSPGAW